MLYHNRDSTKYGYTWHIRKSYGFGTELRWSIVGHCKWHKFIFRLIGTLYYWINDTECETLLFTVNLPRLVSLIFVFFTFSVVAVRMARNFLVNILHLPGSHCCLLDLGLGRGTTMEYICLSNTSKAK